MDEQFANATMTYLTGRRMSSLGNLATHFGRSVEEFTPVVRMLESQNRLRLASSRCQSDCADCYSCGTDARSTALSEKTILISLEQMEESL